MSKRIKLVIVDDHEVVRKSFISLLKEDPNILIVGEAENGKHLLELLKQGCEPDIILLDLEMPVMSGDKVLPILMQRFEGIGVIILSQHYSESLVSEFLSKGVRGYLAKNCKVEDLFDAIYDVKNDGHYFNKKTAAAMLTGLKKEKALFTVYDKASMSDREIEILKLLCDGKTNKEMGKSVSLTPRTIDFHRQNIYKKTKCKTTAELVKYAIKNGIVSIDQQDYPSDNR